MLLFRRFTAYKGPMERGNFVYLLYFCFTLFFSLPASGSSPEILPVYDNGKKQGEFSISELNEKVGVVEVEVQDPNEQAVIRYKAFPLLKLLEKAYGPQWKKNQEFLFTCVDGFQQVISKDVLLGPEKPFLAFSRVGKKEFSLVKKIDGSNEKVDLGPFYVVWKSPQKSTNWIGLGDPKLERWAYQVASIDIVDFNKKFPGAAPPKNASKSALDGFQVFRSSCMACHTVNGDGGVKGPELNYPVSVTEYFKNDWLKKFISDPQSVRFNSSMPGYPTHTKEGKKLVHDVVEYLKVMAKHKRAPKKKTETKQDTKKE